jgi:hypothetical protein
MTRGTCLSGAAESGERESLRKSGGIEKEMRTKIGIASAGTQIHWRLGADPAAAVATEDVAGWASPTDAQP